MNSKYIRLTLIFALLIGLLIYLVLINFSLPFMTGDEMRYIVATPKEVMDYALVSGRYSSMLMIPFAEVMPIISIPIKVAS